MAYDDDGSRLRWHDFEDIAALLERYVSAPENLSVNQLAALTEAVHAVVAGRDTAQVPVTELAEQLRARGLGNVPFDVVAKLADAVSAVPAHADATEHVTLHQARRLLGR